MERRKPKLLIIGHARHGKDTFADLVVAKMDLSFVSSSEFVGRVAIWEQWGKERYAAFSDMFEDRVNNRAIWFNAIVAYNTPNLARTGEEMMAAHDVYVGMRNPNEFHACMDKGLFDHVIWVDGSQRHPPEDKSSNGMTRDMADIWIDNNGPVESLNLAVISLQKRLHDEGYLVAMPGGIPEQEEKPWNDMSNEETMTDESDLLAAQEAAEGMMNAAEEIHNLLADIHSQPLNYKGIINPPVLDPRFTAVEDNSLSVGEDPFDPPKQSALHILEEKVINPPMVPNQGSKPFRMLPEEEKWVNNPGWETKPEDALPVLDHGFFKVLEVMGSDDTIADSARMSYGRGTRPTSTNKALINYLVRHKHTSPLEMGEIRFHIRMPIFVMRQWVRHRTANLNEYSGRYSEMVRLFYVPEIGQICLQDKVNKQGSAEPMSEPNACMVRKTIEWSSDKSFDEYEKLLRLGVSRETARIVLPLNTYTEVVWKLDISNLIKFLWLRDDDHAQWEIQQYAKMVAKAVEEYFPLVYAAYLEARQSQTFTMDEVRTLVTKDLSFVSNSQAKRLSLLMNDILS